MRFTTNREYNILIFDATTLKGCHFRRRGSQWKVDRYGCVAIDSNNPATAWKSLLKTLGGGAECMLIVGGALEGGTFFQCTTLELPLKSLKDALEFELPQYLLQVPEDCRLQFTVQSAADGNCRVNVYAFPAAALHQLAAVLTQSHCRADEFIYPLLALDEESEAEAVFLPEVEPDYYFQRGTWHRKSEQKMVDYRNRKHFILPDDGVFELQCYRSCLFLAELVLGERFKSQQAGIRSLPKSLRPRRYRAQLRLTALLLVLLFGNFLWGKWQNYAKWRSEYRQLTSETAGLVQKTDVLQSRLRGMDKELKELTRVVDLKAGELEVVDKLAALSTVLPSDMMVSGLRWSEKSLELQLQTEAENPDLAAILRPLTFWRIEQLQQRRINDSVIAVTLSLTPVEAVKP